MPVIYNIGINPANFNEEVSNHFYFFPLSHLNLISFCTTSHPSVTPGIPFFLFLVLLPFSIPWMEVESVWICVVHYLACLCPTIGSVVYHVFMNHVGGEHVYDTLLSLDMFGVCLVNTLGMSLTKREDHLLLIFTWCWLVLLFMIRILTFLSGCKSKHCMTK